MFSVVQPTKEFLRTAALRQHRPFDTRPDEATIG
jgi:hypothetical protein